MALNLEKEVDYLTSPEHLRNLTKQVASDAMKAQGLRERVANHFGVPLEQVDDQMIDMYKNIPPQDEMKDEVV